MWQSGPYHAYHAKQVLLHGLLPGEVIKRVDRTKRGRTVVVDQNIQLSIGIDCSLDDAATFVLITDVSRHWHHVDAVLAHQLVGCTLQLGHSAGKDDQVSPFACQPVGDAKTNSHAATTHDGNLTLEPKFHYRSAPVKKTSAF